MTARDVNTNELQDLTGTDQLVLVDFWATWCGPCRQSAPGVDRLAGEYSDALTVAKVDVDTNPEAAAYHHVTSVPTFILMRGSETLWRASGAKSFQQLAAAVDEHR